MFFTSIKDLTFPSVRKLGSEPNTLAYMVFSLLGLIYFRFILTPRVALFLSQLRSWGVFKGFSSLVAPEVQFLFSQSHGTPEKLFLASLLLSCHFLSDFSASGTASKLANESRGKTELNMGRLLCTFSSGFCPLSMPSKRSFLYFYSAFLVHSLEGGSDFFFFFKSITGRNESP